MKVTKLELKNWGPHEKKSYTFHGGLIGIVGKNGAGKSNLLQAINYALTGDLNKQKQSRYIRNYGEPDGAKSASVRLDFVCHGEPVSISRTITETGSKREFSRGDVVIRKAAELDAAVQTMFGVDIESLEQAVFLKQGELARLVKGTPSERFAIFQKLVNLNFLEKRASDIPAVVASLQGSSKDITPAINSIKDSLSELDIELNGATEAILKYDAANALVKAFSAYSQALYEYKQSSNSIVSLQEQETNIRKRIREMQEVVANVCLEFGASNMEELRKLVAEKNKSYELLSEKKKNYESYCTNKKQYDSIVDKLSCAQMALASFIHVHGDLQALKDRENELNANIAAWNTLQEATQEQKNLDAAHKDAQKLQQEYEEAYKAALEEDKKNQQELQHVAYELQKLEIAKTSANVIIEAYANGEPCPCCGAPLTQEAVDKVKKEQEATKLRYAELTRKQHDLEHAPSRTTQAQYNINIQKLNIESIMSALLKTRQTKNDAQEHLLSSSIPIDEDKIAEMEEELSGIEPLKTLYNTLELKVKLFMSDEEKLRPGANMAPPEEVDDAIYTTAKNELLHLTENYTKAHSAQEVASKFQADEVANNLRLKNAQDELSRLKNETEQLESKLSEMLDKTSKEYLFSMDMPDEFRDEAAMRLFLQCNLEAAESDKKRIDLALGKKRDYEAHLSDLQEQQNQHIKQLECANKLTRIKEVIGKKGVLLAYMTDVFSKITTIVQDLLPQLGANFSVRPDPDNPCSYLFTRTDSATSMELPQEMLSGGQAIRLALAMLLACQRVILPDVGLLVLDEPTSHIDADGVASMRNMFLKMNELLCNSEMTVILVDHNTELMESIPNIIKL